MDGDLPAWRSRIICRTPQTGRLVFMACLKRHSSVVQKLVERKLGAGHLAHHFFPRIPAQLLQGLVSCG